MSYRMPSPGPEASRGVYRDDSEGLRIMLAEEHKRHARELAALSPAVFAVFRRRLAALGSGGALLGGGLLLFAMTMTRLVAYPSIEAASSSGVLTMILLGSWVVAAAVYGVLYGMGPALLAGRMRRAMASRGESSLADQLERARALDVTLHAVKQCDRLECPSAVLLLMGTSLLLPLTIHYAVAGAVVVLASGQAVEARGFDFWIALSALVVGHVHAVALWHGWRAGKRLHKSEPIELELAAHDEGWRVWKWATLSSCVPGVLLLLIPVFLVAATGLFLPGIYAAVARRIGRQRDALANALPQHT